MNRWFEFILEGRHYLKTARNGHKRNTVFNNELVSNLIGLSVEKLLVGLCMHHGFMPADHTISGIVAEVHRLCPLDSSLAEAIQRMDRMQNLCALDVQPQSPVGDRQVEELLSMNERVAAFVEIHTHQAPAERAATM
ncbi:MAG: hypothetical protein WAU91_10290 [Desulfatitalea sp.]